MKGYGDDSETPDRAETLTALANPLPAHASTFGVYDAPPAYPERVTRDNQAALTMTVFGMINWTFTWLKPGGKLSYAEFAEMVIDLLAGGLPGARAEPAVRLRGAE